MYQAVIDEHSHLSAFSEQRISDQLRVIINNKMICEEKLQQIRDEVANDIQTLDSQFNTHTPQIADNNQQDSQPDLNIGIPGTPYLHCASFNVQQSGNILDLPINTDDYNCSIQHANTNCQTNTQTLLPTIITEIEQSFLQTYEYFKNTIPTSRPSIPKQRPSRKLASIVHHINNTILPKHLQIDSDFKTTQTILYCAAYTAATQNGSKINIQSGNRTHTHKIPLWQKRLQGKIDDIRAKIGRLTEYCRGNRSERLERQVNLIKSQYKIHSQHEKENSDLTHFLDTLKQKLNALSSRLRRYKATTLRANQNKQFSNNEKNFYRTLD